MDYVLRLQALDGYYLTFNEVFGDRFTRVLCVHHTGRKGDNPHYHFALTCDYKKDALRKYLKGHFTQATGNRHLSLKDWDGDEKACSYMFHEGTEPVIRKGFTDDQLDKFRIINDQVKLAIKKNAPAQIVQDATEFFKDENPHHQTIFVWIMRRLRANGDWLPNRYQMDRWIMRIQANLKTDRQYDSYLVQLYEGWYGQFTWKGGD